MSNGTERRLSVPLTEDEWCRLEDLARGQLRTLGRMAQWVLRRGMGFADADPGEAKREGQEQEE